MQNKPLLREEFTDRVLLTKRIKEYPLYDSWFNKDCGFNDSVRNEGILDYSGLNDHEKLCLYVFAWNTCSASIVPRRKAVEKKFGWSRSKVQRMFREIPRLTVVPAFDENTGLLCGSGYEFVIDLQ